MLVEMSGAAQGYGRTPVFEDLDLELGVGITGLLGPNGAGKTTLLNSLATMTPLWSGSLTVAGHGTSDRAGLRAARAQIGFLPQKFGCYTSFTVTEFVSYCAWLRGMPGRAIPAAAGEAIAAVKLEKRCDTKIRALSGGMRQRCGIAQAIVGDPKVIILDEPTVGLDPRQRVELRRVLRERTGAAIVLSTHLVEDVRACCDRVWVMKDGRFVFEGGTVDEFMTAGDETGDEDGDSPIERAYLRVMAGR